jgi:transcriptional regulator with XRE-family HTH domain
MSSGGRVSAEKLVNVVLSGLGWELKHIRNQRGLSLEVVCQQLRWQQSKLSRMENGQQHISDTDLASLLVIYEVCSEERRQLLRLAQRQDAPGYWNLDAPIKTVPFKRLELEATSIVDAQTILMPGLVQTADYAHALMAASNVPADEAKRRVDERMARKDMLDKRNPPNFDMILDEMALRRPVGGHAVMAGQLRALLELAERPNVRLWVLPIEQSCRVGFHNAFYMLNFARNQSVIFLESKESCLYLEDEGKIEIFRRHAGKLGQAALNPPLSRWSSLRGSRKK